MKIGLYTEKQNKSNFGYYLFAVIIGIISIFIIIYGFKFILFMIGFIIDHILWFIFGIIVFIILKKLKTKKQRPLPVTIQNA